MKTELYRVQTADGLLLDGVLYRAEGTTDSRLPVDACLLVHGTGSNFYASGVLETFAKQATQAGVDVLRINTRGHDGVSSIPSSHGSVRGGAAWESIAECVYDLEAWGEFLVSQGKSNIALVGHSMGGVKSLYFASLRNHPAIRCVIGIAPPRFLHAHWMSHPNAAAFRESYAMASQLAEDGAGDSLMQVKQPLPMLIAASGFIDKYGRADNYDYVHWLSKLSIDTLLIYGTRSLADSPAFDSLPAALDEVVASSPHICRNIVDGANTPFHGHEEQPFELAAEWLTQPPYDGLPRPSN